MQYLSISPRLRIRSRFVAFTTSPTSVSRRKLHGNNHILIEFATTSALICASDIFSQAAGCSSATRFEAHFLTKSGPRDGFAATSAEKSAEIEIRRGDLEAGGLWRCARA